MKGRRITKRLIDILEPDPTRNTLVWDSDVLGFGVCVSRGGCKSYVFEYRANGIKRRMTLGKHGRALTADQAREIAVRHRLAVQSGADPAAQAEMARKAPAVAKLAERYLAEHCSKRSASTRRNAEVLFRLHILPAIGARPVKDVTWEDIDRISRKLADRPVMANRMLALCSKAWGLAARWGWFPRDAANPGRAHDRNPEPPRGRALDGAQLGRIGAALEEERDPFAVAAFRFALLTGARPGEVLAARWEDVDLSARVWRLPEAKTGARPVFLGEKAAQLLADLPRVGAWVFPGSGRGGHLASLRDLWERIAIRADLPEGFRLYDASRHTFATQAMELEVPRDIAFRLTGHAIGGAAGDRYRHGTQVLLRAADLVSGWLHAALERELEPAAKVLPMRA
jgi:integrase